VTEGLKPVVRLGGEVALSDLLAKEGIRQTLIRYCICLDEYDIDGVADCFTEEAVADYGPGRGGLIQTRQRIADRIARGQADFRRTHHQLGQMLISLDGECARSTSYLVAWHERFDGKREVLCLRYRDRLRLQQATWRIEERIVEISWADGFEGVAWRWVPRRPAPDR
jgi:hypothetical protein